MSSVQCFCSFADVLGHLDGLGLFHMDMGLERMQRGLKNLGLTRPPFTVVQIVGTNGKGSSASFLSSIARAHGMHVGLYTSPHFVNLNERIRIDGRPLATDAWPDLANAVYAAAPDATYFEFLTLLAVLAFARAGLDFAVIEAGLGGRYDASSALEADMLCVTPVGMDHEEILGHSLTAIATDKAGALRASVPLVSALQEPEVLTVLRTAAAAQGAPFVLADPADSALLTTTRLGLAGAHQKVNAAMVVRAWSLLCAQKGWPCSEARVIQGLERAFIAGRFQRLPAFEPDNPSERDRAHPQLILDGAHNPHGLRACYAAVQEDVRAGIQPRAVIFSCLADKKWNEMLPLVARMAQNVPLFLLTIADNSRAARAEELATVLRTQHPDVHCAASLPDIFQALRAVPVATKTEGPVIICGSLYLLADFFRRWPECLNAPE